MTVPQVLLIGWKRQGMDHRIKSGDDGRKERVSSAIYSAVIPDWIGDPIYR
ncbi:MAG: hypothetical protein ABJQ71_11125 [Roseibium sp.]